MSTQKIVSGARAKVYIAKAGKKPVLVGYWNNFSFNFALDVQAAFILGRFSAAALQTTGVEPVNITAGGWRVVDHGPMIEGGLTNVRDLLTQDYLLLKVVDRVDPSKVIAKILNCLPNSVSAGFSAKQLSESTNGYVGLLLSDESMEMTEAADASELP